MKKIQICFFLTILSMLSLNAFSQENFQWDVVIDSLEESKGQLYSKAKLFVGEMWNSAQDVIQSDDPESGIILVKGISVVNLYYHLIDHRWTFAYSVKFYVKDNKSRIVIDVYCKSARVGGNDWALLSMAESYPEKGGLKKTNVNEERYLVIMKTVKDDLQGIVDAYEVYMKEPLVLDDW